MPIRQSDPDDAVAVDAVPRIAAPFPQKDLPTIYADYGIKPLV
jgi:hypothetical protein